MPERRSPLKGRRTHAVEGEGATGSHALSTPRHDEVPSPSRPLHSPPQTSLSEVEFVPAPHSLELHGALLITSFPTTGIAGAIACSYLIRTLKMLPVGYLDASDFEAAMSVTEGSVAPSFQAYASPQMCGPDRRCSQLVVLSADVTPPTATLRRLGRGLLRWIQPGGVDSIVTLEGIPAAGGATDPRAFGMINSAGYFLMDALDVPRAQGVLGGFSAALHLEALRHDIPVATLTVESSPDRPDARAAAIMVQKLQSLVPSIPLDPEPLLELATLLEGEIRETRSQYAQVAEASRELGKPITRIVATMP